MSVRYVCVCVSCTASLSHRHVHKPLSLRHSHMSTSFKGTNRAHISHFLCSFIHTGADGFELPVMDEELAALLSSTPYAKLAEYEAYAAQMKKASILCESVYESTEIIELLNARRALHMDTQTYTHKHTHMYTTHTHLHTHSAGGRLARPVAHA